jgi:hypothetical protein
LSTQTDIEQLQALCHLTFDGELIGKESAKKLHKQGYINRFDGWNIINEKGVKYLQKLGFISP